MFCFEGFLISFPRLVFIFLIWKCLSDSWVDDFFSCCLYDRDLILTIFDVTSFLTSFLSSFTNTFQKNLVPCMCCLGFFIILFWCVHVIIPEGHWACLWSLFFSESKTVALQTDFCLSCQIALKTVSCLSELWSQLF